MRYLGATAWLSLPAEYRNIAALYRPFLGLLPVLSADHVVTLVDFSEIGHAGALSITLSLMRYGCDWRFGAIGSVDG